MNEYTNQAIEPIIRAEPEGHPGNELMFTDDQFFEFYERNAMWLPDNEVVIHDVITTWMEFLKESNDRTTHSLPNSLS